MPPTHPLHPVNPNNACPLRITAAAGTELAGASSQGTVTQYQYYQYCYSSLVTELYNPKAFIAHAASLRQGFPHCERFSTAASRRSLGSVSVPVWLTILSDQLLIRALVSRYLTNKLIRLGLISEQKLINRGQCFTTVSVDTVVVFGISPPFGRLSRSPRQITQVFLTLSPLSLKVL